MEKLNLIRLVQDWVEEWVEEWVEGQEMEEAEEWDGEASEV